MAVSDEVTRTALSELHTLALTIFGEAAGELIEGKVAVGCVVRNRVLDGRRFGRTYKTVCHRRAQFSCWWRFGGEANYNRVMAVARAFVAGVGPPLATRELAVLQECLFVAEGIIGGQLRDRVNGATHYYAPDAMVPRGRVPDWAASRIPSAKAGRHLFFAGVA